ncbi:MAG: hypothetical protein CMJ76_04935 [Planctomycetaceae bacterium]|nr:hypothetical protein [Planctomycetaceae bacterium]
MVFNFSRSTPPLQCFALVTIIVALCMGVAGAEEQTLSQKAAQILKAKCVKCHSSENRKADLDLSSVAAILRGGESGTIVAANYEDSLLWEMIANQAMPPEDEPQLSAQELEILKNWLEQSKFEPIAKEGTSQWDILPVLQLRCVVCHGKQVTEAGLDLRTHASILKGGKSGPAIIPGNPTESLLLKKIHAGEMPPKRRIVEASIKVITSAEIEKLETWIAEGASNDPPVIDSLGVEPDPLVSEDDRDFWAFKVPLKSAIPEPNTVGWSQNNIDSFVLNRIEQAGLKPSSPANKETLIRRVYFDLLGIPPTIEQVQEFLSDDSPMAYEQLIERVLASPYYGERWGGLWLDLAGYSDSEGISESDPVRPSNYLYRDYVIRSFNADKPYSDFLKEQLAGDDLADYTDPAQVTQQIEDNLIATGFLRQSPDGSFANITGFVPDRNRYIGAALEVYSSAVLGLTLKCAKCHSHKFDPLPQRDYYRLLAVFKGALDENAWMSPLPDRGVSTLKPMRLLSIAETAKREAVEANNDRVEAELVEIRRELSTLEVVAISKLQDAAINALPEQIRTDVRSALNEAEQKRSKVQQYLVEKFEKQIRFNIEKAQQADPEFKAKRAQIIARITAKNKEKQEITPIRALWDRGDPSPTYILTRGDYLNPSRMVGPGVPSVLTDGKTKFTTKKPYENSPSTGRRLALAQWTVDKSHPLTARVMVNRIWKHHFHQGIVKTLDNFGLAGAKPSHPELLDWLAVEFMQSGWSLKHIHRLIMTSSTYQQSSSVSEQHELRDPQNKWLSRMPMRRMDAEMLRDSLITLAGVRWDKQFGPGDLAVSRPDGLVTSLPVNNVVWRRSIYVLHRRTLMPTLLTSFDRPRMSPNCIERTESTVAPQALHLMNNKQVNLWAGQFAKQIVEAAGNTREKQVRLSYLKALSRQPDDQELALTLEYMQKIADALKQEKTPEEINLQVLSNVCHALINSAAFIYID